MTPTALETLITNIGSVWTFLFGFFDDIFSMFLNNPVLTIVFGIFVTGAIIGLVSRVYKHA
jgi:hypothetical protein